MEDRERAEKIINLEEINRLLEVGRILFSVLNSKEIEELRKVRNN